MKEDEIKSGKKPFLLKEFIDFLTKLLPVATFLVIVASSVKLAIFYNVFHIKIVDYIGISEYLPLFIDDLHSLLYTIGTVFLGIILVKLFKVKPNKKEVYTARLNNRPMRITWLVLTFVFIIGSALFLYFRVDTISERLERIPYLYYCLLMFLFMIATPYENSSSTLFISAVLGIFLVPLLLSGYTDAYIILDNRNVEEHELIFEDYSLKSNETLHFLGKSQDYIFLYDSAERKAIIKLDENLKEIRVIQKSN